MLVAVCVRCAVCMLAHARLVGHWWFVYLLDVRAILCVQDLIDALLSVHHMWTLEMVSIWVSVHHQPCVCYRYV